jgi:hypothetical protein
MPGPTSTDSNFERTFSDLAFARLRDKAPTLLDYLIGFQLIDKNEEETHAVGVFGFKIGNEWVYAPVFFINGELKGHELLYVKSQDAFVPLTEEWTNYILNRRPSVLGESEVLPRNQLPIRQPDFDVFARAPYIGSKYAAHHYSHNDIVKNLGRNPDSRWATDFMPNFWPEHQATTHKKFAALGKRFDVCQVLRSFGKQAVANLVGTMRKHSDFADAVLRFYDFKDLADFEKKAAKMTKEETNYQESASFNQCKKCQHYSDGNCSIVAGDISANATCDRFKTKTVSGIEPIAPKGNPLVPKKAQDDDSDEKYKVTGTAPEPVVVIRGDDPSNVMHGMSDADKEKLLQDNYVVKDERSDDQRSRLYKTQINQTLQSPTESGFYEIITSPGEKRHMLVVTAPKNVGLRDSDCALVIDPGNKRFGNFYTSDILVSKRLDGDEWVKAFNGFSPQNSLDKEDIGALVGPDMNATVAFRVDKKWVNQDGQTEMDVHSYHLPGTRNRGLMHGSRPERQHPYDLDEPCECEVDKIVLTGKPAKSVNIIGSTMFVPDTWKAVKLPKEFRYSMGNTIDLPSLPDVVLKLYKTAMSGENGIRIMKLRTDGIGYSLELNGERGPSMTKLSMLRHLICGHGLGQDDAETAIKEASPRKAQNYFLKYAYGGQPGRATFPEPIYGDDPDLGAKVMYPMIETQNIGEIDNASSRDAYGNNANDRFIDPGARQNAIDAANQGQKEVLDTAVITGLVKTLDTDNLVDSYIGDLLLGLDRIGRILFLFYWHNEKFKDRYGQQDLIELEDNLRNVFENLGELALFLKQKTIEPEEADSSEVELSDVIG